MKRLFQTSYNESFINTWLLLLRVLVASFMLVHGLPKTGKLLSDGEIQFSDPLGIGVTASLFFAVLTEAGCSFLLILGLGTRIAAAALSFTMLVIVFLAHGDDPFKKKELAILYLLIYITLVFTGPGKYSLDNLINKRLERK
jgi:putative oxidoreductase